MPFRRLVIYLFAAGFVFSVFVRFPGINDYGKADFGDMVYGKAYRPFVYRALVPWMIRAGTAAIPESARTAIEDRLSDTWFIDKVFTRFRWNKDYLIEFLIGSLIMYGALVGFGFAARYLMRGLYTAPGWLEDMVPVVAVVFLLPFFRFCSYTHDFADLALFTLALGLMVREKWMAFLAVFAAACLNKETAILLTVVFAVHYYWKRKPERMLMTRLIASQLTIFAVIKAGLYLIYRDNPGTFLEFHLVNHNIDMVSYSFTGMFSLVLAAVMVFYRWKEKPAFLRDALWIVPPLFVMILFFGFLDELRAYYEAYPVVLLLVIDTLSRVLDIDLKPFVKPAGDQKAT